MNDEPDGYQAYMLRLWRARCKQQWQWRASLESPHTGERQSFARLEQLIAYLLAKTRDLGTEEPTATGSASGTGSILSGVS
jgi:hypothetical protein